MSGNEGQGARDGADVRIPPPALYAGAVLLGIALGNAWILMLLVPVVLLIHFGAILPEERYLERKFGDEYASFKASVRRWI